MDMNAKRDAFTRQRNKLLRPYAMWVYPYYCKAGQRMTWRLRTGEANALNHLKHQPQSKDLPFVHIPYSHVSLGKVDAIRLSSRPGPP